MNITIADSVLSRFSQEEQRVFQTLAEEKIPVYIQQNFFRIKPIRTRKKRIKGYEMKLCIGKKDYRIGFYMAGREEAVIFFASPTLQKVLFDQEAEKALEHLEREAQR